MNGFAVLRWRFSVCFLFALRRKARRVVLAQLCKSCSFFSPLGAWQVFQWSGAGGAGRGRWQLQPLHLRAGRQPAPGPFATALVGATATRNAAPTPGKRQHTWIGRSAVTSFPFLQAANPLNCKPSSFTPRQRNPRAQCCGPGKSACKYCK